MVAFHGKSKIQRAGKMQNIKADVGLGCSGNASDVVPGARRVLGLPSKLAQPGA